MITQNTLWTPQYGKPIKLKHLSDEHLNNIISMLKRNKAELITTKVNFLPYLEKMKHKRQNPATKREKFNGLCRYLYQESEG